MSLVKLCCNLSLNALCMAFHLLDPHCKHGGTTFSAICADVLEKIQVNCFVDLASE